MIEYSYPQIEKIYNELKDIVSRENKLHMMDMTIMNRHLEILEEEIIPALEQNNLDRAFQIKLVDCDKHKEECAKNNIPGFPTLLLHKNNSVIPYEGNRKADDLIRFLKQNV